MATRKKKPHWDAGRLDDLLSGKVHEVKPSPDAITPSHSTGTHLEEKKQPEPPVVEKK